MSWPSPDPPTATGPLAGLRVLDLSRILAGPYATTLLGDLGADVIKVEHPAGDETRRWGPPFVGDDAAYFFTANRNRRSIALDLKTPDDRQLVQRLAAEADVVVENFLGDAAVRLGVDHRTLRAEHPQLIHCTISGYGSDSSRARWPALDFVIQAHAGIMGVSGPSPDEPTKAGAPVADMATGLFAAVGILALLPQVGETGVGGHVEVALADACTSLLANQAMNWLLGDIDPQAAGNTHPNIAPYQTVAARDRPFAIAATSDDQFRRLCGVIRRLDLVDDPRFATNAGRVAHREELVRVLDRAFAAADAHEWVRRLNEAGVASAVVNRVSDLLEDTETAGRMVTSVRYDGHDVKQLRSPIRLDGDPLPVRTAPPRLGEHDLAIRSAMTAPTT